MNNHPLVAVAMGSQSDWDTMQHCCYQLENVKHSLSRAGYFQRIAHLIYCLSLHRVRKKMALK